MTDECFNSFADACNAFTSELTNILFSRIKSTSSTTNSSWESVIVCNDIMKKGFPIRTRNGKVIYFQGHVFFYGMKGETFANGRSFKNRDSETWSKNGTERPIDVIQKKLNEYNICLTDISDSTKSHSIILHLDFQC